MANMKSSVNVKIDSDVKETATELLARMGLDQTTAIDMFFRQVIAERRLPFQPTAPLSLDEQLIAALERTGATAKEYTLEADKNGGVIIDRNKQPELYDWATNG